MGFGGDFVFGGLIDFSGWCWPFDCPWRDFFFLGFAVLGGWRFRLIESHSGSWD